MSQSQGSTFIATKMAKFEEEIDYKTLVSNISDSEIVKLDWPSTLTKIQLQNNVDWIAEEKPNIGVVGELAVGLDAHVVNKNNNVSIEVVVYSNNNLNAINQVMKKIALSSSIVVNLRRIYDGPGDLFLVHNDPNDKSECIMVYKNTFIEITTLSTIDVTQFANYLFNLMKNELVNKASVTSPDININISKHNIKIGDEFTSSVNVKTSLSQEWKIDLTSWPDEGLEIIGSSSDGHVFRATELGSFQVEYNIYHEKTLVSYSKKIHINVIS